MHYIHVHCFMLRAYVTVQLRQFTEAFFFSQDKKFKRADSKFCVIESAQAEDKSSISTFWTHKRKWN